MTCVMCAPIARRGLTGRVSAGSLTSSTSERIARETLAHPLLPKAFKRAGQDRGPDEHHELLALRHNQRRSILTSRQHLINEAEHLLSSLPLELSEQLPDSTAVRPRLTALAHRNRRRRYDRPTALRLTLLDDYRTQIARLDDEDQQVTREPAVLVRASGSTLGALCGLSTVLVSELLVEVGDPRRFTIGGVARFNAPAPLPAPPAQGPRGPARPPPNAGAAPPGNP